MHRQVKNDKIIFKLLREMVEQGVTGQHDIRVRLAQMEDVEDLLDFKCRLALDTENKTLDRERSRAAIAKCIANPRLGCYLLAWDEADPQRKSIGTTMITYEMSVAVGGLIYFIKSVFVVPEARRKGVFRSLFNLVI